MITHADLARTVAAFLTEFAVLPSPLYSVQLSTPYCIPPRISALLAHGDALASLAAWADHLAEVTVTHHRWGDKAALHCERDGVPIEVWTHLDPADLDVLGIRPRIGASTRVSATALRAALRTREHAAGGGR